MPCGSEISRIRRTAGEGFTSTTGAQAPLLGVQRELDEQAQPLAVHEGQPGEVHHHRRARPQLGPQGATELLDVGEVELALDLEPAVPLPSDLHPGAR